MIMTALLKSPVYPLSVVDGLKQFVLSEACCDVHLYIEAKKIPAHQVILSSASDYFKTLFATIKLTNPVIVINDVNHDLMKCLLQYMYTGSTNVNQFMVEEFMKIGRRYKVKGMCSVSEFINGTNDVQDLSQHGPSRQQSFDRATPTRAEKHVPALPKLLPHQHTQISPALMNHPLSSFDNPLLSSALSMQTTPQYLSTHLNSPSRACLSNPNLPKQSPHRNQINSPKPNVMDEVRSNPTPVGLNGSRFSRSPEDSVHNSSMDLSKENLARMLATKFQELTQRKFQQQQQEEQHLQRQHEQQQQQQQQQEQQRQQQLQQQMQPPISVAQSVLETMRSISRSPETVDTVSLKEIREETQSPHRNGESHHNHDNSSNTVNSHKPHSSGASSSDCNNYSDDESSDHKDNINVDGTRSDSPGPSTSTARTMECIGQNDSAFVAMNWKYSPQTENKLTSEHATTGFWKNSFKNSLLAPYLSTSIPPVSPGSHTSNLSPTFPGLYPPTSLSSSWRCSSPPPSIHSMPFLRSNECGRCGRLYKTRKGLKHHIKNECGVEPRFQCTRCDWKFKQKAHLLRHMARKHTPPT